MDRNETDRPNVMEAIGMSKVSNDLIERFRHHRPGEVQELKHAEVRERFLSLAQQLERIVPNSDEKRECIKSLDLACMWANAAIARNQR